MHDASILASKTPRRYHCIHCLHESGSLYRKFSTTSIKLSVCEKCGMDVDPYVEREIFLVVLDLVLLRQDAYRHLLLNRLEEFQVMHTPARSFQYIVASSIFQTCLAWEAFRDNEAHESLRDLLHRYDRGTIALLLYRMFPQMVMRIATFWGVAFLSIKHFSKQSLTTTIPSSALLTRTYLATVIPTFFAVATILVLVWENTYTVRVLGSLLILTYQALSIYTVGSVEGLKPVESALTVVLAIALGAMGSWIVSTAGGLSLVPCAGFLYTILGDSTISLCLS